MNLLTVKQAASRLNVSTKTIYRLMNWGKLRKLKIGGATRISEDELNAYLEQQYKKGAVRV